MSENRCVRCTRPLPDQAYVCRDDTQALADALLAAAGHAEDAETVIARQARYGSGARGGSSEPLPVDLTASARYAAIGNTITTWARHVLEECRIELPAWRPLDGPPCYAGWCEHDSCRAIRAGRPASATGLSAGWLATQVGWLRKRPEAGQAFGELHDACDQLARLVDRPPDKELVGMCDCGKVLYAPHRKSVVTCPVPTCRLEWGVERSRDILRRALDGKLVTAAEAARLSQYLDTDRTQQQIRKLINAWATRSLIVAHGEIREEPDQAALEADPAAGPKITPTYRFGDIANQLARAPRRTPRAA